METVTQRKINRQNNLFYGELAKYYDLIYSHKNYKGEVNEILDIIHKYKKSNGGALLDIACGTGKYLEYLQETFSCTGVDLNQAMLDIAKKRLGNVKLFRRDMLNLRLNTYFDIITCLFGAIAYARNYQNLKRVMNNFYKHLKPGGILIIDGWYNIDQWKAGAVSLGVYGTNNLKIIRVGYNKIKGNTALFEDHYLIAKKRIKHFSSEQQFGLFGPDTVIKLLNKYGFKSKIIKDTSLNNTRYVAVKQL